MDLKKLVTEIGRRGGYVAYMHGARFNRDRASKGNNDFFFSSHNIKEDFMPSRHTDIFLGYNLIDIIYSKGIPSINIDFMFWKPLHYSVKKRKGTKKVQKTRTYWKWLKKKTETYYVEEPIFETTEKIYMSSDILSNYKNDEPLDNWVYFGLTGIKNFNHLGIDTRECPSGAGILFVMPSPLVYNLATFLSQTPQGISLFLKEYTKQWKKPQLREDLKMVNEDYIMPNSNIRQSGYFLRSFLHNLAKSEAYTIKNKLQPLLSGSDQRVIFVSKNMQYKKKPAPQSKKKEKQPFNKKDLELVKNLMKELGPELAKKALENVDKRYRTIYNHLIQTGQWQ